MFFRKHPFARDGLLSIALAVGWSIALEFLCKFPESIICGFFRWMFSALMEPALAVINGLVKLVLHLTGLNPSHARTEGTDQILALSMGIPLLVIYWFLLGGTVCLLWRFARGRIRATFVKNQLQKLT